MHTRHILFALAIFFISTSSALANVSPQSTEPSLAQGFSFYCTPYGNGFENGKHYIVQTGPCAFSLPQSIGINAVIGLYQGTVGDSVLFSGEQVPAFLPSNTTLVTEDQNTFFSIPNETDFFSVVYDKSLNLSSPTMNEYLTGATTTLPAGAVLNQTYYIVAWKWGPKPVADFNPVIIVPDIFDTWQKDTGLVVDPVFNMYQNLVDTFVANGYVLGQTLFLFPYNWHESNVTSAEALAAFVESVKTTCQCGQVDIIAHGMGGFVATQFITATSSLLSDVNNLSLVGVPFGGVSAAYPAWEAGQFQFGNTIQNGLAQVLLTQESKDENFASLFNYIQTAPVASLKELLPPTSYINGRTYPAGYPSNTFLENLQANFLPIFDGINFYLKGARLHTTLSAGVQTPNTFGVIPSANPPLWPDGQVSTTQNAVGDGFATRNSAEWFVSADQEFPTATHNTLPSSAASGIFTMLNNRAPSVVITNSYPVSCVLFITTSTGTDMQITSPTNQHLGKNFSDNTVYNEIPNSLYSGFNAATEYGLVVNPTNGVYGVQMQGSANGSFTVNASDVCGSSVVSTGTSTVISPGQVVSITLTVATTTQTLTIKLVSKSPLTVTADNKTIELGGAIPPLTATLSGFVGADTPSSNDVTGSPLCTTTATPASPVGIYPITCTAGTLTSNNYRFPTFVAGTLTVGYRWDGFLQPINDTAHQIGTSLSVFKGGSTVPAKFQLKTASGATVQSSGGLPLWLTPIKLGPMSAGVSEATYSDPASSGNNYEWDGQQYHYNWKTKGFETGYWYRIYALLPNGQVFYTTIGLR